MNESLTATLEFVDTRFDLRSSHTEESNQCYGKDVARVLSDAFLSARLDPNIQEEDWGWCVTCPIGEFGNIEVGIYPWGYLGDEVGKNEHLWRLRLMYYEREKVFGLLPIIRQKAVPTHVGEEVRRVASSVVQEVVRLDHGEIW